MSRIRKSTIKEIALAKDLIEELRDKSTRRELSNALNRKNPVRNFHNLMENNIDLYQHWRMF